MDLQPTKPPEGTQSVWSRTDLKESSLGPVPGVDPGTDSTGSVLVTVCGYRCGLGVVPPLLVIEVFVPSFDNSHFNDLLMFYN